MKKKCLNEAFHKEKREYLQRPCRVDTSALVQNAAVLPTPGLTNKNEKETAQLSDIEQSSPGMALQVDNGGRITKDIT